MAYRKGRGFAIGFARMPRKRLFARGDDFRLILFLIILIFIPSSLRSAIFCQMRDGDEDGEEDEDEDEEEEEEDDARPICY